MTVSALKRVLHFRSPLGRCRDTGGLEGVAIQGDVAATLSPVALQ